MGEMKFDFHNVIVLANEENVFTALLKKRRIEYVLCTGPIKDIQESPDLILVINRGIGEAEKAKKHFPAAQVVQCQGGVTHYSPRVRVVFGQDVYDSYWYTDWDDFLRIIGQCYAQKPPIFTKRGGPDLYCPAVHISGYEPDRKLTDYFMAMLPICQASLQWQLAWLDEVAKMLFDCAFSLPKSRRRGVTISRVSLPILPEYCHRGLPVFHEEAKVTFFDDRGEQHEAIVDGMLETEIRFRLGEALSAERINRLVSFQPNVYKGIPLQQLDICNLIADDGMWQTSILRPMVGYSENFGADPLPEIYLTRPQLRMLKDDESQARALLDMVSSRIISVIMGAAGTGKTFLSSLGISQFYRQEQSVLVVSHSNRGLDVLLNATAKELGRDSRIFRLGNDPASVSAECLRWHRSRYEIEGGFKDREDKLNKQTKHELQQICSVLGHQQGVVVGCTMDSFLTDATMSKLRNLSTLFDVVFIDEASRGYLFELLPVFMATGSKVVASIDPDQLGNIDLSPDARQYLLTQGFSADDVNRFSLGWFNLALKESLYQVSQLEINRRSLPCISQFISQVFYDGRLIAGRFEPDNPGRVELYDTSTAQANQDEQKGTSFLNHREANLAVDKIVKLLKKGVRLEDIGVITPYRAQIELVRGKLRQLLSVDNRLERWRLLVGFDRMDIEGVLHNAVNTVDAFQGSQRKVIILSMVRSNDKGDIGFNRNVNRLRVAFSRAEDRLIVIGNVNTFLRCDSEEVRTIFAELFRFTATQDTYEKLQ